MTAPKPSEPAARYEVRSHTAIITLNRPHVMNAVNSALSTAVGIGLERAAADPEVRAIVLTGVGRAFCAGADLKELAQRRAITAEDHPEWGFAGFTQHWIDKPVIAAVNGFAMGGGTELVLASDLAVASSDAKFGLPEVQRGLLAAAGGVIRTQRQLPLKRALELALTGDSVDASKACDWGLVNRVAPPEHVLEAALELAARIALNAPIAVAHTKSALHRASAAGSDWNTAWVGEDPWQINEEAMAVVFGSEDALEGPRAFAERRAPQWSGR